VGKDNNRGAAGDGFPIKLGMTFLLVGNDGGALKTREIKMDDSIQLFDIYTLRHIPELVAWAIGIALAIIMVRRGGSKAEKLLLSGCCLMFVIALIHPFLSGLVQWMRYEQILNSAQSIGILYSIPLGVLGIAGFVCLVIAFWLRFWRRKPETA